MLRQKADTQASTLSGGQQKLLEVARGLLLDPQLILIDEPSIGLSPLMVQEVFAILKSLRDKGVTILLIEQNAKQALADFGLRAGAGAGPDTHRGYCAEHSRRSADRAAFSRRRFGPAGARMMTGRRILLGLIGANIMGSLSPALFADAFEAAGIEGFYHLMDVDRLPGRQLPQLLDAIKTAGFAGTNITYPFKQDILALLDAVDPEAAQIGAINTVAIAPDGRTTGYNFDRRGWRHSFEETLRTPTAREVQRSC